MNFLAQENRIRTSTRIRRLGIVLENILTMSSSSRENYFRLIDLRLRRSQEVIDRIKSKYEWK